MTSSVTAEVDPQRGDRSVPLLVAAAVLVVAVVGAVLVFGVQRPPELPSVADEPDPAPSGAVAWTTWRDGQCVHVAEPDGEVRQPFCRDGGYELEGWDDEGHLVLREWRDTERQELLVDAETGEVVDTGPNVTLPGRANDDRPLHDLWTDGELIVEDASGSELWRVAAPEGYRLGSSSTSPDGEWIAAIDSADRLLVLPADGGAPPRVWATGVDSYRDVVWEQG